MSSPLLSVIPSVYFSSNLLVLTPQRSVTLKSFESVCGAKYTVPVVVPSVLDPSGIELPWDAAQSLCFSSLLSYDNRMRSHYRTIVELYFWSVICLSNLMKECICFCLSFISSLKVAWCSVITIIRFIQNVQLTLCFLLVERVPGSCGRELTMLWPTEVILGLQIH